MTTNQQRIRDMKSKSPVGDEQIPVAWRGRNFKVKMDTLRDFILSRVDSTLKVYEVLPSLPLFNIVDGVPYAIGPDSDGDYTIYMHFAEHSPQWVNMGNMNAANIQITQGLGDSDTLVMSQRAVTEALKPIILTQEEFDQMISNGEITDNDTTIRYIID